jgi:hypothetical protein
MGGIVMSYFPQGLGPGQQQRLGIRPAIALGCAAALGVALVVGVISGLSNIQFAYGAVLVGLCAGLVIRRSRTDSAAGLACAVVALIFSAVASVVALITHIVKDNIPPVTLSFVLEHISTVISHVPHYIGFLGFLFWALGAYVGWATVSGRGRRRGVRAGFGGRRPVPGGPYTGQMYGAPGSPVPGAPAQPFFTGGTGQPGYGAGPGQTGDPSAQGQYGFGGGPGYGAPPSFGADQGFGGPADQPPTPPVSG